MLNPCYISAIYVKEKLIGYRCYNYYLDLNIYNSVGNILKKDAERNVKNFIKHCFYIDMKHISDKNKSKYRKIHLKYFNNINYSDVSYKIIIFDEELRKLKLTKLISKLK